MTIINGPSSQFLSSQAKSSSRVGNDILAYCGFCKMNLSHTIISLGKSNRYDRVQCNTCKTETQFRAPKTKSELAKISAHVQETEKDDETEIDLDAGAKVLAGTDSPKKKSKAKNKAKKRDESSSRASTKGTVGLPLSLQEGTVEDIALYDSRYSAQKNNLSAAKEYKVTISFKVGDIINHKTFGIGFVITENGLNKIEVLFSKGRKLLINGIS